MLPTPAAIAHRDARRLALVLRELGGDGAPVGSGWMACDVRGSWADYAAGLGVSEPVTAAELDTLVAFYEARGREPRIQVTPYQHPSLLAGLAERGFVPYELDTALARSLHDVAPPAPHPGLEYVLVDATQIDAWEHAQLHGFFEGGPAPAGMGPITRRVARAARCQLWLLVLDGDVVGSGGLETFENSAVLIAGEVHPEARRRGLQSHFIRFRLAQAAAGGFDYALVGSVPGGPTERNALRAGFTVVYTQVGLRRP